MDKKKAIIGQLQELEQLRCAVKNLEQALQVLTPEERLVVDMLLVRPKKGNAQVLCELLDVEQSSVYRRRDKALKKLGQVLLPQGHTP